MEIISWTHHSEQPSPLKLTTERTMKKLLRKLYITKFDQKTTCKALMHKEMRQKMCYYNLSEENCRLGLAVFWLFDFKYTEYF